MADELLPAVKLADWKDRASPRRPQARTTGLRELRTVVAASRTVILDEEGRALAKTLKESLDRARHRLRDEWLARITNAIKEGRVQQALEASIRPPSQARAAPPIWPSNSPPPPEKP